MLVLRSLQDPALIELLLQGKVGIIPTDTIYGLAAQATNKDAVERLYRLKHRERKPGTIVAASVDQLVDLGLDEAITRSLGKYWPNPVSIIIPAGPHLEYLDQGLGDLAVRIPAPAEIRTVLEKTGPLVTSSANHPGQPPANTVVEAQGYFNTEVDFYVDGGDLSGRPPSTVVRLTNGNLEVLRQGAFALS